MNKQIILSGLTAVTLLIGAQAPAQAGFAIAKPSAAPTEAATVLIKAKRRHGGFRRKHFRRRHFRHRHWRGHRRWRHFGHRHYRHRYHGGRWAAYRRCMWKQDRGHRIRCIRPRYYY